MLKFHKGLNNEDNILGVYISSTKLDNLSITVISYFMDLFQTKKVKTELQSPLTLLFDPELNNYKLDIKVSAKGVLY